MKVLVVAPHPDDESLGCGGTLIKHKHNGDEIHWLIMTSVKNDNRYSEEFAQQRQMEIKKVDELYGFASITILNHKPATLDHVEMSRLIDDVNNVCNQVEPNILYLPYRGVAHSDHAASFDAASSCTKSFRNPYVKSVRVYETLSETDFGVDPDNNSFRPNYFVDVADFLEKKIEILNVFESEMKEPPFPRNNRSVRAQALLRGQVIGTEAAEAFMILKEAWID